MNLRQVEIARETGLSEMTICRRLRALDRTNSAICDFDAVAVFASQDLESAGMPGHTAIDLLAEFSSELRWLTAKPSRQCWLVFAQSERAQFTAAAISASHLASLVAAFPMSRVLPLHEIVHRAQERLIAVKAHLARQGEAA
ncbi:hypothetical protein [Agrobacterium vitis]|uniref:hypothetical protein n=1 Tax=Agrobacterium vitis TaxID=373 RepID=UPI0015728B38|nr:hypothetical protein [Agrobacterium vitis]NSZ19323.1 hypothetical protein [Agrobacterium vitis]QZO06191.1 hypothetical protein K4831_21320 [Agrobacterium vitis]UJL90514.1 hypothetical protein AVF2S5_21355 [Agrobacterium vitis]